MLFALATGLVFWLGRLFHSEAGAWGARVVAEVALLSLATGLAYVFWDRAMRAGDVMLVASCSYLTPFFSTVVSCLYLDVRPSASLWGGVRTHHRRFVPELAFDPPGHGRSASGYRALTVESLRGGRIPRVRPPAIRSP
jgi:drug/metabolite transporter (DMT)-like permease